MFWKYYFITAFVSLMLASFASGDTITQDGTVIENQHFTGTLNIKANGCVIRNCTFDVGTGTAGSWYGIHARHWDDNGQPYTRNLIENCVIRGAKSANIYCHYTTVRRCYIYEGGADGIKMEDNCIIEYNYITKMGMIPGSHADGIQSRGGDNCVIRYNNIYMPVSMSEYNSNAAIIIQAETSDITNVQIYGNTLEGGNYTVYLRAPNYDLHTTSLHDNVFGSDFRYGPLSSVSDMRPKRVSVDGNLWDDNSFMDINLWDGDNK